MWMLIVQIYWKDMVLMRKTARKLVLALLFHLHEVSFLCHHSRCCLFDVKRHVADSDKLLGPRQPRQGHSVSLVDPTDCIACDSNDYQSIQFRLAFDMVQVSRHSSNQLEAGRRRTP